MTQTPDSRPPPAGENPQQWSSTLTNSMWWCRFSRQDVNHIERLVRDHMSPSEATVEYTHIEPVPKKQGKKTFPGAGEQRILRAATLEQLIDRLDEFRAGEPEKRGPRRTLYHLILRCTAEGHVFEMRLGTPTGYAASRIKIHGTWPGREKSAAIRQVWEHIHKRRRLWWVRVVTIWTIALSLSSTALSSYGQRVVTRWRDPSINRHDLLNEIGGAAVFSLLAGLTVLALCQAATSSRVIIRRRLRLRFSAGPLKLLHDIWRRWKEAIAGADVMPGMQFVALILGVLALLVALLAWLLPVR